MRVESPNHLARLKAVADDSHAIAKWRCDNDLHRLRENRAAQDLAKFQVCRSHKSKNPIGGFCYNRMMPSLLDNCTDKLKWQSGGLRCHQCFRAGHDGPDSIARPGSRLLGAAPDRVGNGGGDAVCPCASVRSKFSRNFLIPPRHLPASIIF